MNGVRLERKGHLTVLRLDKARGNAIDEPLVDALREAARALAADDAVRGVLLASAHPLTRRSIVPAAAALPPVFRLLVDQLAR